MCIFFLDLLFISLIRASDRRKQIACDGITFMHCHRSEIHAQKRHTEQHHERQDRVEVVRDRLKKNRKAIDTGIRWDGGSHCRRPGADWRDDTHRSCRRIYNIGKLCARYLMPVCHRTHDASDGQTVKIIVHKDQHTEQHN